MIEFIGLKKSFDKRVVLNNLSFKIPYSKITVIAGGDGAGKSTILKILVGLLRFDSGKILLKGDDVSNDIRRITEIAGYMPEKFSLYMDLTVEENMNFFADVYNVEKKIREEIKNEMLEKTGMIEFKNRKAGALSGGMKQKLALSTILLSQPELIILDEPTTGVDPLSRIEFFNVIEELRDSGKTIIISTPYLDEAEKADYIIFLKNGDILKMDYINSIKQNFPAKLYKMLPKKNIFEQMEELKKKDENFERYYIRGKYIKYLETNNKGFYPDFPVLEFEPQTPTLEDIYLFYERVYENEWKHNWNFKSYQKV